MILGEDPAMWDIQCNQQDSVLSTRYRYIHTRFFCPFSTFLFR
jgi:hypothetical protein